MAEVKFKAKVQNMWSGDEIAYRYVAIPELRRGHCDMAAFRCHPKWGGLANSDLFPNVLRRIRADLRDAIRLDRIPANVTVDTSGFLATVTIHV